MRLVSFALLALGAFSFALASPSGALAQSNSAAANATATGTASVSGNTASNTAHIANNVQAPTAAPPAILAPGLVAGSESCLGSTSVGASGSGFGFLFGTTMKDEGCNRRLNAKILATLGYRRAAVEVLCLDPEVHDAMEAAGTRCKVGAK